MGAPFDNGWEGVAGAMYTGAGSSETLWFVVSVVICVAAIFLGGRHESDSYRKLDD